MLVTAYRAEADVLMVTDEKAGGSLLDAAFRVQTVLIGLLEACDTLEFNALTQPPHEQYTFLEHAVVAQCKMLLGYSRLQLSLEQRWAIETPDMVHKFAQSQWFGQATPGRSPPTKLVSPLAEGTSVLLAATATKRAGEAAKVVARAAPPTLGLQLSAGRGWL